MKCKNCGRSELTTGDVDGMCAECRLGQASKTYHNYGWICPVCGRGNAPYTSTCPCMGSISYEVTCSQ